MATQEALDSAYMDCAEAISKLSHAKRKKVGSIIVAARGGIIAEGVNGTPSGFSNECERKIILMKDGSKPCDDRGAWSLAIDGKLDDDMTFGLETLPEVLHAESNAIAKLARSTNSSVGATLYTTAFPCFSCAKLIIQVGIIRVVYKEEYASQHGGRGGRDLLERANISVEQHG
jgi:dCMP deaminase